MRKVITYGTFDHLHQGHINILKRAKQLGDYLIVGVTSDNFDMKRGKINVSQSLYKRIQNVSETGLADEIIVEEYEGQKIDDIIKFKIDTFVVGSDWIGKFDYLNDYCKVVYLERTEGVSSTQIRSESNKIKIGIIGNAPIVRKFYIESQYVNGVEISGTYDNKDEYILKNGCPSFKTIEDLIKNSDAVYVCSKAASHFKHAEQVLNGGKHCIIASPLSLNKNELEKLYKISEKNNLVLMEGNKTAYSTSFYRMILLVKGGVIGDVISINSTCTSLEKRQYSEDIKEAYQGSFLEWVPTAILPIFKILGTDYNDVKIISKFDNENKFIDNFSQLFFVYGNSCANVVLGSGVKSEGELIISGTKGYIYVPAPRWKSEIFEIRFEDPSKKKVYYYRNDGEGLRYQIAAFADALNKQYGYHFITKKESMALVELIDKFMKREYIKI